MDYHKVLVRSVVRAFYGTEHIVVIDLLVAHYALSVSDIAVVLDLGKQIKNVQRICTKLREAGLISTYSRQEMREGALKPITREYFYIDYRHAIDATKYRIHMIDERIKRDAKPTAERKEYECSRCTAQWTMMEVLDNPDPHGRGSGFLCKRCGNDLSFCNTDDVVQEQDDRPSLFNRQFSHLLALLQKIDETTVPEVTGEQALNDAVPIPRDHHLNPAMRTQVVVEPYMKPSAVQGLSNRPTQIEISITTDKESSAAEVAAAAEHRAKITAQNALPTWYTHSTVTGEATGAGARLPLDVAGTVNPVTPRAVQDKSPDPTLDAYFAALKAEQERAAQEATDDEDEDDEFEDVAVPVSNLTVEEPVPKRARTEEPVEQSTPEIAKPAVADDDDDDDEFEDVV